MTVFLIVLCICLMLWLYISIGMFFIHDTYRYIDKLTLYKCVAYLPVLIFYFPVRFLLKTNVVQAFHKFMLQKPSDVIKFRIVIEKGE